MKKKCALWLLMLVATLGVAQALPATQNYWIFFTDKDLGQDLSCDFAPAAIKRRAQMGIPFLVSRSGLTQMGFEIAEKVGITMIGRATNKHFLLFTGGERFRRDS